MAFLVAIEGTLTVSQLVDVGGNPASVAHWPQRGAAFKGSFQYHPMSPAHAGILTDIYVDFGSFHVLRDHATTLAGTINLLNGGQGIQYVDGWSPGFTNVSLPAANWQLNEFQLNFDNSQGFAPHINPMAIDFNLFAERTIVINGANGNPGPTTLVFHLLCRIDCLIALPLGTPAVKS